jgi:phage tail-like protein
MKLERIKSMLPGIFQRAAEPDSPLYALLGVMEALHQPSESILDDLDVFFDPRFTLDDFIPMLAGWMDLDRLFPKRRGRRTAESLDPTVPPMDVQRLRMLVANASWLAQWRGTIRGLRRFLELATGSNEFEFSENFDSLGQPRAFHLRVLAPEAMRSHQALLYRIIRSEKPAYVTFDLTFRTPT